MNEERVRAAVDAVIPLIEAIGALVIVVGVVLAFGLWLASELRLRPATTEDVRLRLAHYLVLGLEFQLGADVLGTAVSPTFTEIGRLGAIAAIRTAINYFLQRDLHSAREPGSAEPLPAAR